MFDESFQVLAFLNLIYALDTHINGKVLLGIYVKI